MKKHLFIIGQTASGKSSLAHSLAKKHNAEIISIDSMKVYRGMDIGTAKPALEKQQEVTYHMIDIVDPDVIVDVNWYMREVEKILDADTDTRFILEGGSALYVKVMLSGMFDKTGRDDDFREELETRIKKEGIDALHEELKQVDPEAGERIFSGDEKRIMRALEVYYQTGETITGMQTQFDTKRTDRDFLVVCLRYERELLYERINKRIDKMYEQGFTDEVKGLYDREAFGLTASHAIGYKQIIDALGQGIDPASHEVREKIKQKTRYFSRKQMTWFKKFTDIHWFDLDIERSAGDVQDEIELLLKDVWK